MYTIFFKRLLDFILALIVLLIFSPAIIITIICLSISYKGNPFFFQERPGKNENLFKIIKFKTMNDCRDKNGNLLPDNERITTMGNFVRKTSLDELPQLINVLKGDMSLVGPRPLLQIYLSYYTPKEKKRHNVKPGITGYAQVNGRNFLEWDQKLQYDVYYVEHLSFLLDVKILFKTVYKVLFSKDVSVDPSQFQPPLHIVRQPNKTTPN